MITLTVCEYVVIGLCMFGGGFVCGTMAIYCGGIYKNEK